MNSNELIILMILPRDSASIWINPKNQNKEELLSLLKPYPAEGMKMEEAGMNFSYY